MLCNLECEIIIGGKYILFGNVSFLLNYWDLELGCKISGICEMCVNFFKLI